jgi:uncharacterized membrane protein
MADSMSLAIDAPLEAVWDVLSDVEAWPGWTPTVTSVRPLSGGPGTDPALGADYELEQPRLPKVVWEIAVWDPPSRFDWVSRAPGVITEASHDLTSMGDQTTVTLTITRSGLLAPVINLLYGRITREYLATEAASLKKRVEAGAGSSAT